MKRLHLVIDSSLEDVKDRFLKTGKYQQVTVDYSLDAVAAAAESDDAQAPDCLLIFDGVTVSGLQADGKIDQDRAMLRCIEKIRYNWPNTQVVMVMSQERSDPEYRWFISRLTQMAIFDLYPVDTFSFEDLETWVETQRSWQEVAVAFKWEDMPNKPRRAISQPKMVPAEEEKPQVEQEHVPAKQDTSKIKLLMKTLAEKINKVPIKKDSMKKRPVKYQDERLIVVWNTHGQNKAETALEIARQLDASRTVLIEMDTTNPRLDRLMGIPGPTMDECGDKQKPQEVGMGLLTCKVLDIPFEPAFLKKIAYPYKYGINYFPCGNTFGRKVRELPTEEELKAVLSAFEGMWIVADVPCDENNSITPFMWQKAHVIEVPDDHAGLKDLQRLGFPARECKLADG